MIKYPTLFSTAILFSILISTTGCNDPITTSWECRLDPRACPGEVGSYCDRDGDCASNYCCTEKSNCDSGMCSIPCDKDEHCPPDMACEHDTCFFTCRDDRDCAAGQKCEHGNTVCEWP